MLSVKSAIKVTAGASVALGLFACSPKDVAVQDLATRLGSGGVEEASTAGKMLETCNGQDEKKQMSLSAAQIEQVVMNQMRSVIEAGSSSCYEVGATVDVVQEGLETNNVVAKVSIEKVSLMTFSTLDNEEMTEKYLEGTYTLTAFKNETPVSQRTATGNATVYRDTRDRMREQVDQSGNHGLVSVIKFKYVNESHPEQAAILSRNRQGADDSRPTVQPPVEPQPVQEVETVSIVAPSGLTGAPGQMFADCEVADPLIQVSVDSAYYDSFIAQERSVIFALRKACQPIGAQVSFAISNEDGTSKVCTGAKIKQLELRKANEIASDDSSIISAAKVESAADAQELIAAELSAAAGFAADSTITAIILESPLALSCSDEEAQN
ncbi:MAG: hypothetical protein CL675_01400 [Bdellovibrionaceae bacterium]|nr:hypothetical protein [Pseudobdellovibrionaceae bacterium]